MTEELRRREETERRLVDIARKCLVRDERKAKQNQEKLLSISQVIIPSSKITRDQIDEAILHPHYFIHEGPLTVISRKSKALHKRYFFLFDDCLAETHIISSSTEMKPTKEVPASIRHLFSAPVALLLGDGMGSSSDEALQVFTKERRFIVRAETNEELNAWANAFRLVVGGTAESSPQLQSSFIQESKTPQPPPISISPQQLQEQQSKQHPQPSKQHPQPSKIAIDVRKQMHRKSSHPSTIEQSNGIPLFVQQIQKEEKEKERNQHKSKKDKSSSSSQQDPPSTTATQQQQKQQPPPPPPSLDRALSMQYCLRCGENLCVARRRHNCGICGKVVCPACSEYRVIPSSETPDKMQIVCQFCSHLPHQKEEDQEEQRDKPEEEDNNKSASPLSPIPIHSTIQLPKHPSLISSQPNKPIMQSIRPSSELRLVQPQQNENSNNNNNNNNNNKDGDDDIEISPSLIPMSALPLTLSPQILTFGNTLIPVDGDAIDYVSLINKTQIEYRFRFLPQRSHKYNIYFEPIEGIIRSLKTKKVKVKIVPHCTTKLSFDVALLVWRERGGPSPDSIPIPIPIPNFTSLSSTNHSASTLNLPISPPSLSSDGNSTANSAEIVPGSVMDSLRKGVAARLGIKTESQLSSKLDGDELTLTAPAVGDGAFGAVYRGNYRGMEVAVKVLKNQSEWTASLAEDFLREVRFLETVHHSCIVNFVGAVHKPGELAIVTEFVSLGNLTNAMKRNPFSHALRLKSVLDCAKGMAFLHDSSIMHRDLKPTNLLVVSLEVRSSVVLKISDFGTIRDLNSTRGHESSLTRKVGSVMWMAPEVLLESPYSKSADVFSFAIILYEVISGEKPYYLPEDPSGCWHAQDIQDFVTQGNRLPVPEGMPEEVAELMISAWSQDPKARPEFSVIASKLEQMLSKELSSS